MDSETTTLTASATGFTVGAPYQSGGLVMAPTTYAGIQILVAPQVGVPGSATGKNVGATANAEVAGVPFYPTVRTVDRFFNITNTGPLTVALQGTDPHDSRPGEYQIDPLGFRLLVGR